MGEFTSAELVAALSNAGGLGSLGCACRTPFIDHWQQHLDEVEQEAESLHGKILEAMRQRKLYKLVLGAGQSAGIVDEILPAAEIVRQIAVDAEQVLRQSSNLVS
jgi:nitronate monooxygenase/enoyl-[acyl-carrier protein] reductase II